MSQREYRAMLDKLRVQDCVFARMKPSEIARRLGKDKAWVSRAIKSLEEDKATTFRRPEELPLVQENLAMLECLLAKTMRIVNMEKEPKRKLAAMRVATDMIRQRGDYQIAVGLVQRRVRKQSIGQSGELPESIEEALPLDAVCKIFEKLREINSQPPLYKPKPGKFGATWKPGLEAPVAR
jgi:DNA-binding Lrp family transcriptional regulator